MKNKLITLAFAILAFAACSKPDGGNPTPTPTPTPAKVEVTGISLSKTTLSMIVGDQTTLTATVSPDNATDKTVTWASDKADVAKVENGKVTAVAKGTAKITATAGSKSAVCEVTVDLPPMVVTGDASSVSNTTASVTMTVNMTRAGNFKTFEAGIVYGYTATPTKAANSFAAVPLDKDGKPDAKGQFTLALSGLDEGTEYHFLAYAKIDGVEYTGDIKSFKTTGTHIATAQIVDLALPSGLKWAGYNVGATKPEEVGSYFCWGETATKLSYAQSTYKYGAMNWYNHNDKLLKYNTLEKYGPVDKLTTLTAEDDAATVNWGANWRMPTDAEKTELLANTTHVKYTYKEVAGFLFTSKNNGESIFFPMTGYLDQVGSNERSTMCAFWTSSVRESDPLFAHVACNLISGSSILHEAGFEMDPTAASYHLSIYRNQGLPVRAVYVPSTTK